MVRAWLGEGDYELEWRDGQGGTRSELGTPLWAAIEEFVGELEPGARLAPICVSGFTDSHWLREAFGTVAYGFFPLRAMSAELAARLIHSADERIPVDDLELGVQFLRYVADARLGSRGGMAEQREKVRLGGMALQNGVLVHGPTSWAVAVRTDDGELKVASGRKRPSRRRGHEPAPARPGAAARRVSPPAAHPAGAARGAAAVRAAARARGDGRERGRRPAAAQLDAPRARGEGAPRRRALARAGHARAARLEPRRLPRRRAHLDRDLRARRAARKGARALRLAPDRAAAPHLRGRRRARRAGARALRGPARVVAAVGALAAATEVFSWMVRHPEHPVARALARPGHELQHRLATAEPDPAQLEVAEAALGACLALEEHGAQDPHGG